MDHIDRIEQGDEIHAMTESEKLFLAFCEDRKTGGDVLMWDNKSTETAYTFPPSHLRQFKRYIRDSSDPVAGKAGRL